MSAITDAQATAVTNGETDKAAVGAGGTTAVPVAAVTVATVPVFVSGTAQQLNASRVIDLYINITTSASLAITMGPTSAGTGVSLNAAESDALGLLTIRIPAGWYIKLTGTVADMAFIAIVEGANK